MSKWTHNICVEDYERATGVSAESAIKLLKPENETCCFCGRVTNSGIYIRFDPEKVKYCNHDRS